MRVKWAMINLYKGRTSPRTRLSWRCHEFDQLRQRSPTMYRIWNIYGECRLAQSDIARGAWLTAFQCWLPLAPLAACSLVSKSHP